MKIAIDPGHGNKNKGAGYDPGAVSGKNEEADIALQWGLTGKWKLLQSGFAVWMTRDDDSDPAPVGSRDDRAEAAGCDIFISLHCNAAGATARGTETFYRDARDKVLAAKIQSAALKAMGSKDRGLKTESESQHSRLAIFDFDGPACLLEIGFITNPQDCTKMLQRQTRIDFWGEVIRLLTNG